MARNLTLPGNQRYQPASLQPFFGYDNLYQGPIEVELAVFDELAAIGVIPEADAKLFTPELRERVMEITTTQVDERERKVTKHDVRALVQLIQEIVPPQVARWIHIPLTSYDVLDTGRSLMYTRTHEQVVSKKLRRIIAIFADLVEQHAGTRQIGRTHGQHALPITVGFWLATILDRILRNTQQADQFASSLVGKISGAVGAYNAQEGLGIEARCGSVTFEERVLYRLGLKPAKISTQILPPEPLAYYLFSLLMCSAALAQFGRDARNLMRSEIREVAEPFKSGQVGSSTMAHKRNPITFEGAEGAWIKATAEFLKVLLTLVSEHQRDLVGSAPMRDYPTIVVDLVTQMDALLRSEKGPEGETIADSELLARLRIDTDALERNFSESAHLVLAEPAYIALQIAGYPDDAHHLINHTVVPVVYDRGCDITTVLYEIAENDDAVSEALDNIPSDILTMLGNPRSYIGRAEEKALEVVQTAREFLTQ